MPAAVIIVVIDAVEVFDGAVARFAEDAVVLGAEVPTRGRLLGVSSIVERPGMEIGVGGGDVEVEADEKHVAMVALMEMGSSILPYGQDFADLRGRAESWRNVVALEAARRVEPR